MSKYIVAADRRTAYAELAVRAVEDWDFIGCLLRINTPDRYELQSAHRQGVIEWGNSTALTDYVPMPNRIWDVGGNPSASGVELIHSLICGYGNRMLVVDRIEWMLRMPEARDALIVNLPRIYEAAHDCRCPVWIVNPAGCAEADSFMAGMRLAQGVRQMGGPQ